jgi:2'-5' RNA ligase
MRVNGPSLSALDQLGDDITVRVTAEIRGTLRSVTSGLSRSVSVDDLGSIRTVWDKRVDARLLPVVAHAYWQGVNDVAVPIVRALNPGLIASVDPLADPLSDPLDTGLTDPGMPPGLAGVAFDIPRVTNPAVEQYLQEARNRLVNIGNEIWEHARGALLDELQAGSGIADMARAINSATGLSMPRAEVIARTEVNGAANAGALSQMQALNVPATKTWLSTGGPRTRPWHLEASGQTVDLNDNFEVGGEAMSRPHDAGGSPANTINCRCTLQFDIPDDQVGDAAIDSEGETASAALIAAVPAHTGAMIALIPADIDLDRLALDGGEPRDELHLTLLFLGDAATWDDTARQSVVANAESLFSGYGVIEASGFGVAIWNPISDTPALVLNVGDGPTGYLTDAFDEARHVIDSADMFEALPLQHEPWSPHCCLAYSTDLDLLSEALKRVGPIMFDRVRVAFGDQATDISLAPDILSPSDEETT